MTQLQLQRSLHEHGSSSGPLDFHECGSTSRPLDFHERGSSSKVLCFHGFGFCVFFRINILIVLMCFKFNEK